MKFCSECSAPVQQLVPDGDNRPRHVCPDCGTIHYQNPNVVTGCLVESDDKILLCRRNIDPRKGFWTLPAGFLENGETTEEGAIRETYEETLARVRVQDLFAIYSIPHINQVYMMYRATLVKPHFGVTDESDLVELVHEQDIPWDQIAFPVIELTLKSYFEHKQQNLKIPVTGTIDKRQRPQE